MIKLPFVVCEWEDAWGDSSESVTTVDAHTKHKPAVYRTYGFLLYEDEKGISLTNEECVDDESFRGRNFINRALIRSVTKYKLAKDRKRRSKSDGPPEAGGQVGTGPS